MTDNEFNPLKITGVTVTWEVENIWSLSFDGVSSGSFLLSDHIFHLCIRRYELSIAVYLCRDDAIPTALSLLCNLCMVDHIGQEKAIGEKEVQISKGKEVVLINSINIEALESQKAEFLINETLVLRCNVSASYRRNVLQTSESVSYINDRCLDSLSCNLGKLLGDGTNSDVVLRVGDAVYKAHRLILSARSPTFARMFRQEPSRDAVDIKGVDSAIFGDVLHYIYTGKVRGLTLDSASKLIEVADKYRLHELKGIGIGFLAANLSVQIVCDAILVAEKFPDEQLEKAVLEFLCKNADEIVQSEQWQSFKTKNLAVANSILSTALLPSKKT